VELIERDDLDELLGEEETTEELREVPPPLPSGGDQE